MYRGSLAGPLLLLLGLTPYSCIAQNSPGGTYQDWLKHRDRMLRDSSLVRLYAFDAAAAGTVANTVDQPAPLSYESTAMAGAGEEPFTLVAGRWPGKRAVRLDRGVLSAEPFTIDRAFTAEIWFRKSGYGALRGNSAATDGTIVSVGSGYWDGWRVTTSYPDRTVEFEIGRPQPSSSVGLFGARPLADGVWNYLAATWDGREMRLYLNGMLAGSAKYDGVYTPPGPGGLFRIGYADSGRGSVKMDVDEVALYTRALSAPEVREHSLFYAPERHPDRLAVLRLEASAAARAAGDSVAAVRDLAAVVTRPEIAARLRMAAAEPLLQYVRTAGDSMPPSVLSALAAMPGVSAGDRIAVRVAIARRTLESAPVAGSRQLAALLADPALTPAQASDLRLEGAHALRAAGRFDEARAAYAAMASLPGSSPSLRAYCRLLIAQTWLQQKRYPQAAAAHRELLGSADLPTSFRIEAEEALQAIPRLRAGLPGRDPTASRIRLVPDPKPAITLWIRPGGSDSNPGTATRPLRTLLGARDRIRSLKESGPLPMGGVAVVVRPGTYAMTSTVALTAQDSGTVTAPIIYRGAPGEDSPVFTGGVRLRGFSAVTDPAILARIPPEARSKVAARDLKALGITDYGSLRPHGYGFGPAPVAELFWNGQALHLARWPNTGWAITGKITQERTAGGGFAFQYEGERPARWAGGKDAWLHGYFGWLWADDAVPVAGVDPRARTVTTTQNGPYAARAGMPYFAYNLLEELDAPGEWYLDRDTGILYVYPPSDPAKASVELSMLSQPMVTLDGVSNVRLERLTFELGRSDGIVVRGGGHCLVSGCTVRRMGGTAITLDGGAYHGVFGCDLYSLGRGGVSVKGGDRRALAPSGMFVENCHIYDFSRWDRTYTPAVLADGVAIRIAHNLIHDTPGHALRLEGNDHLVAFNEVCDAVYETDDQGGIDIFGNPTYRGIVLRDNYWHHIGDGGNRFMCAGIRLDDAICGVTMYGNTFYKASDGYFGGIQIHGGKENVVDNNLFVDCRYGISFSQWGAERWGKYLQSLRSGGLTGGVAIGGLPYSVRYPALGHLAENPDANMVWRNVACGVGDLLTRDNGKEDTFDSLITRRNPGMPAAGSFEIAPDSWIYGRTGFQPIPFREIGLYAHPFRATWPVRHTSGAHYDRVR